MCLAVAELVKTLRIIKVPFFSADLYIPMVIDFNQNWI